MIAALKYLIEMLLCSGIFILLYKGLVEGRVSYKGSRIYLIISVISSAMVPLMEIPIWPSQMLYMDFDLTFRLPEKSTAEEIAPAIEAVTSGTRSISWIIPSIYAAVSLVSLCFAIAGIIRINMLRSGAMVTKERKYTLAENEKIKSPFSFIKTIFIGTNLEQHEKEIIITHESSHIRHHHSEEKLFMKLMTTLFWINPFIHLSAKYLEEVQEWEADSDVLAEGHDIKLYRFIIFKQLFGYCPEISCGLKNSNTKKRFLMMDTKIKKYGSLRLAIALILTTGTCLLFGATAKPVDYPKELSAARIVAKNPKTITINITNGGKSVKIDGGLTISDDWNFDPDQTVVINADPDVEMGIIMDIKQKLRATKISTVIYHLNQPKNHVIEIRDGGKTIRIDGRPATDDSWNFGPGHTVQIKADPDVPAEVIKSLKKKLQK